jgi:maltose-binding protein MalE
VQKAVIDDPQWATFLTPEAKKLLAESLAHGKISPLHPKWPQLQRAMEAELTRAFEGAASAREAVQQAHDQMQALLVTA